MRKMLFLVISLVLMLLPAKVGFADDGDVVLSEVMFNSACEASDSTGTCGSGTADETQFEWVEIFNKSSNSVSLTGWVICDKNPGAAHANCDSLSGTINAGQYWVIAHNNGAPNNDLQSEFSNYSGSPTVDNNKTIFINSPVGDNGLAQGGDAVFIVTDVLTCGTGSNLPCVSDCVSWDSTNTCANLIDNANRAFLAGSDGHDDTALTSNEQDGQSIVNIGGTWYQSGPNNNTANQASPYGPNTREGGTTDIILLNLSASTSAPGLQAPVLLTLGFLVLCVLCAVASAYQCRPT